MSRLRLAGLTLLLAFGACELDIENGQLRCSIDGRCPRGFHCAVDDACWRDGTDPGTFPDLAGADLAGADLAGVDLDPGLENGAPCADKSDCASGVCSSEGVCCAEVCEGACQSCKTSGALGACKPISGLPVAPRSCGGDVSGACIGVCNGSSASCTFAPKVARCGPGCAGTCDGAGACSIGSGGVGCAGDFACGPAGCLSRCSTNADCAPLFLCNTPTAKCEREAETECFNGADDNGDGKTDCADSTCLGSRARCVPIPAGGLKLGAMSTGTCTSIGAPGSLIAGPALHQDLVQPTCTTSGCNCQSMSECEYTVDLFSAGICPGGSMPVEIGLKLVFPQQCVALSPGTTGQGASTSLRITSLASSTPVRTCTSSGAGTKIGPTWTTTRTYCELAPGYVAKGCAANEVCLPLKATTSLCVRYPSTSTACTGAYPTAPLGLDPTKWYEQFADPTSCQCSCTPTGTGQCPISLPAWSAYASAGCGGAPALDVMAGSSVDACRTDPTMNPISYAKLSFPTPLPGETCGKSVAPVGNPASPYARSSVCCE